MDVYSFTEPQNVALYVASFQKRYIAILTEPFYLSVLKECCNTTLIVVKFFTIESNSYNYSYTYRSTSTMPILITSIYKHTHIANGAMIAHAITGNSANLNPA